MKDLSEQEIYIVKLMREAVPFEVIQITKDQLGRDDHYLITRTQKIVVSKEKIGFERRASA